MNIYQTQIIFLFLISTIISFVGSSIYAQDINYSVVYTHTSTTIKNNISHLTIRNLNSNNTFNYSTGYRHNQLSSIWIEENIDDDHLILKQSKKYLDQKSLHLFSHGKSGQLFLDHEWKTAPEIVKWLENKKDFNHKKHLNIYGCEFAKGEKGKAAVQYLESELDICVAASDDITGADGDWELEVGSVSNSLKLNNYKYNLQCPDIPTPTADGPGTNATYCEDEQLINYLFGAFIPDQFEADNPDYQVNWYSDAAGTQLVVADNETFMPPNPFVSTTVYAQILNPNDGCAGELVTYTLTVNTIPTFTVDSYGCTGDLSTYTINFTSDGTVTSSVGTVSGNQITGIPSGDATFISVERAGCTLENLIYLYECTCDDVTPARIYALAASCTNGVPNDDGYLQISSVEGATHYNYVMGSDYSTGDADIANATALDVNALPLQFGTLPNPTGSQDYTIRVFNAETDCFTDVTVTLQEQDCMSNCSCDEYIYLNEPIRHNTLKFLIKPDGALEEILKPDGSHWAEGIINRPHGLGSDLNGFLYIGNITFNDGINNATRGTDKLDCDGNLVSTDHLPPAPIDGTAGSSGYATNIYSVGNTLYMNNWSGSGYPDRPIIFAYDICTGNLIGEYTSCNPSTGWTWDFFVDESRNKICMNTIDGVVCGDLTSSLNGGCLPLINADTTVQGITFDPDGNIYTRSDTILNKYDINGNLLCTSYLTSGGSKAWALVYSEVTGNLYLSGNDADCISVYNTETCEYITQGVVNQPNSPGNKAMSILKECCPSPNRQTINQTYCVSGSNEQLFLNDLFPCDGIICEGQWTPVDATAAAVYNDCDQSISAGIAVGCYSFTKGSDGLENFPKCGAFELNFNLEILQAPEMNMSPDQTVCSGEAPTELSVTTTATDIQWQMSTTSCTEGFANIDGETAATYTPSALTDTTYYRAIINARGTCSAGSCSFESGCITVNIDPCEPNCTNPAAPVISVNDNDCDTDTVGSFIVDTPCSAGTTLEWSTDNGTTWSTTAPTYDNTTAQTVIARCIDNATRSCLSVNSNQSVSSPTDCTTCPAPRCLGVTITKSQ